MYRNLEQYTVYPWRRTYYKLQNDLIFFSRFRFNSSGTGRLSIEELKFMMEKLGAPQTHLGLKAMIKVLKNTTKKKREQNRNQFVFLSSLVIIIWGPKRSFFNFLRPKKVNFDLEL